MSKIIPITPVQDTYTETVADAGNSRDWAMVKGMQAVARTKPQKNVTPINIQHDVTRQTQLVLVLLPEWGVYFPPYNLSRLAGVTRSAGFKTTIFDINVKSWQRLKDKLEYDPWDPAREWCWQGPTYIKEIHPHLEPIMQEYVERIVEMNPEVVGFSLYYTNEIPTTWMAREIRKRLPNTKLIVGGPQAGSMMQGTSKCFDHIVVGEGEQLIVDILEKIESNTVIEEQTLVQPKTVRLDLDSMPFPDYTDFDFSEYQIPNGISSEVSRGCVAKCVFCTEVHFWKYRGRMSGSVLDEIEYQYKHHGINFVWFIDSLVNGNLKELRAFAQGVVDRGLQIGWQGYSRCDGRMDLDYFKDLKASGCHLLNYGVESGSQRVLDLMKKNITVAEVEQNLQDAKQVGILSSTQWIIGFPGELPQDLADTFTLVWRIRNNVLNIAPGITMMMSPGAEVTDNGSRFDVSNRRYQDAWTTTDMSNTRLHRLIRQKTFSILLEQLNTTEKVWGFDRPNLKNTYDIIYNINNISNSIEYDQFDYNIIQANINPLADTAVNEIWPLLRTLYKALGAYTITVQFEPEADAREFGFRISNNYTAQHKFSIDSNGSWSADFSYNYVQQPDREYSADYSFTLDWQGSGQW
jgi:tRNA A37 methylthiotransferase MiaB